MQTRINNALKTAMIDKDRLRVSTLRLVVAAIKEKEICLRSEDDNPVLDEDGVIQLLSKMVKQRQDSVKAYDEAGRNDLAKREKAEIKIIREFLPKPLTEEEVTEAVRAAITAVDASSIKDMGKVMGVLKSRYTGRMDFGKAGAAVKSALI